MVYLRDATDLRNEVSVLTQICCHYAIRIFVVVSTIHSIQCTILSIDKLIVNHDILFIADIVAPKFSLAMQQILTVQNVFNS